MFADVPSLQKRDAFPTLSLFLSWNEKGIRSALITNNSSGSTVTEIDVSLMNSTTSALVASATAAASTYVV
jgi:hypothetical protein